MNALQPVSTENNFSVYAKGIVEKFAAVGTIFTVSYELDEGVYVHYPAVELAGDLRAEFYSDIRMIALIHGDKELAVLEWNSATEQIIADFDDLSVLDFLSLLNDFGGQL